MFLIVFMFVIVSTRDVMAEPTEITRMQEA